MTPLTLPTWALCSFSAVSDRALSESLDRPWTSCSWDSRRRLFCSPSCLEVCRLLSSVFSSDTSASRASLVFSHTPLPCMEWVELLRLYLRAPVHSSSRLTPHSLGFFYSIFSFHQGFGVSSYSINTYSRLSQRVAGRYLLTLRACSNCSASSPRAWPCLCLSSCMATS